MSSRISFALPQRPRRNRKSASVRALVAETDLLPRNLILPVFLIEGKSRREPISSMPQVSRLSVDLAIAEAKKAYQLGIRGLALFPRIADDRKDPRAQESKNPDNLLLKAVRELKSAIPEMSLITDVAMDPYSTDGHDGLVGNGQILNDETLPILAEMAVAQARAGADWVAPSDMMDGRIGVIRRALDENGFTETNILSYCAKYASAYYGPFREALDSAPRAGDKKTYQMDPSNRREALREARLDLAEGADAIMVKPALSYLDIIADFSRKFDAPIAAYFVSGEYSMICAAAEKGWLDRKRALLESHLALRRAGARMILTYAAAEIAGWLGE
jgi:porphobilinogen synthase